jgi:hypothetical protein
MRAFAFTDAVRPGFQRAIQAHPVAVQFGVRLTRSTPLAVEKFVHLERRVAF